MRTRQAIQYGQLHSLYLGAPPAQPSCTPSSPALVWPGLPCRLVSTWSPQPTAQCASWTEVLWYFSLCLQSIPESVHGWKLKHSNVFDSRRSPPGLWKPFHSSNMEHVGLPTYSKLFPLPGMLFHLQLFNSSSPFKSLLWNFIVFIFEFEFLPLSPPQH